MIAPFIDTVMKDSEEMINFIKSLPKFMVKIFNISENSITPEGFFGMKIMMMAQIFAGIFSIILASNLFANEFENKTIEYLLVKPISRKKNIPRKTNCYSYFLHTLFSNILCKCVSTF
jgi:ABC-2 type transport system permease protein